MNAQAVSASFYHLNVTLTIDEVRQPGLLFHVDRLKDEVLNDFSFFFSFYCRGSAVLCRSLASVCQQVKKVHTINLFDNFLDLSFASGLKAVPESEKKHYQVSNFISVA